METRYWNLSHEPLFDERGRVDGIVTFALEVTEQVLARHAVEHQQRWLEAMLDLMPMPVVMARPNRSVLRCPTPRTSYYGGPMPTHVSASEYGEYFHVTDMQGRRLGWSCCPPRARRRRRLEGMGSCGTSGPVRVSICSEVLPAMHRHRGDALRFLDIAA